MKNTENVEFCIASPGNAFAMDSKPNRFSYAKGMAEYAIEHTLRYSLNLNRSPCSEDAFGKEDSCALGLIKAQLLDSFNCTAPWILHAARLVCLYRHC